MKNLEMKNIKIYQIFYNDETFKQVDPLYIPLDNSSSSNSDWFEFLPIKNFLDNTELEDNTYYGFFSPRFESKTKVKAKDLISLINNSPDNIDVFLSSFGFNPISFHKNLFEQGERAHPGITNLSQKVFDKLGYYINLNNLVSSVQNTAFSNYIVANKKYWLEWKNFADKFYDLVEYDITELGEALRGKTGYFRGETAMRTFIQERAPGVILSTGKFNTYSFGVDWDSGQNNSLPKHRMCNFFKNRYIEYHNPIDLVVYEHIRQLILDEKNNNVISSPPKLHPLTLKLKNRTFWFSHINGKFKRKFTLIENGKIENIDSDGHINETYWDICDNELVLKNNNGNITSRFFLLTCEYGKIYAQGYYLANRKIQFKLIEVLE